MRQHYFWDTRQCNNISGIWGTFRFWPTAIYQDTLEIGVQRTRLQSVRERESKKGGRTYLKDRAGQFTTAKFYCLVKQQFWTPHLYIWRFILNISWSVVHPALNKTCDFRTKKPLRSSCIRNISWNFQMQSSKVYATDCVGKGASECHHPKWQHRHLYWIIPR